MPGIYDKKGRRKYLTFDETNLFKKAALSFSPRDRILCLFLLYTGVRVSEALNFKPADLDISAGEVVVRTLKRRKEISHRRIPLPEFLITEILELKKHPRHRLWKLSRSMAWLIVKKAMCIAGIEGIQATCKGLRHAFGVQNILKGIPISSLQKLMGHKNIESTLIYLDVMGDDLRRLMKERWKALNG